MPITISYDLQAHRPKDWNYIRSMLERFGWQRIGGTVFRYDGRVGKDANKLEEDWLNDVVPAMMFFRSYLIRHAIALKYFTLDTNSVARIDTSDHLAVLGTHPLDASALRLCSPTNSTSSEASLCAFVETAVGAIP